MSEIFLTVVNMSIAAGWIVLAVLLLRLILKKAPKWINVVLWGIVGIRLICPFSFESMLSLIPSNETIPTNISEQTFPYINSGIDFVDSTVNGYVGDHYAEGVSVPVDYSKIIITTLAIIWLVGMAAMLIYTVISYIRIKSKVKQAVLKNENVWLCDRISTPFIFGVIKPQIYLPFNLNEQDSDLVISHEKAHIKRKDYLWKPIGFLILTIHWFNPLMWLGYVLLCRDIELACDEKVIKELDTDKRADYSQALLTCSVNRRMIAACPLAFGEVGVKERVKTVLNYKKPAFWIIVVSIIAVIITAVCLLTNPNGHSLQNIEHRNLTSYQENTIDILKYNGETFEAIPSFDRDKLYELVTIKISKNEVSKNRAEDRDKTNTLVLRTETDSKPTPDSHMKGLYICFNADFTEVWVEDGVKPTLSYKVLNPKKAEKIYNDLSGGVGIENNENNVEPLGDGVIQFYNEPTAENKTVIVDKWATMTKDDLNLFLEQIKNQKWVDDEIVDRLTHYYDCRISYDDFIYIGYDQKVIYYEKWFTELTDENAALIKSYYPNDENSDVKGGEQDYFNGEVLAINDNSIKVKCLDVTKGDVTEGTELNVTKNIVSANGVPAIKVGDTIRVVYTGIRETYPPQLQTVFAIYLVDENGKVIPNQ